MFAGPTPSAAFGLFGDAAAEIGPGKIGAGIHDGLHSKNMVEAYRYTDVDLVDSVVVPGTKGARLGASIGVEGGFVWKY